jgi:hypothetical protein
MALVINKLRNMDYLEIYFFTVLCVALIFLGSFILLRLIVLPLIVSIKYKKKFKFILTEDDITGLGRIGRVIKGFSKGYNNTLDFFVSVDTILICVVTLIYLLKK